MFYIFTIQSNNGAQKPVSSYLPSPRTDILLEEQWKVFTKSMNSPFQNSYFSIIDNTQLFMFLVKFVVE